MPVKVRCRGCQKVLTAPDKARGKVIACPECGTKLKVPDGTGDDASKGAKPPAGKSPAKKPAAKKSADDDDFLAGLGVDQLEAEHGEEKVCPYCAADLDPEDPVCRKCGMNTATGQMDAKEARKRARKGPDPALFYGAAWSDSLAFVKQYKSLGVKTGLIWTSLLTVVLTCVMLTRTWVFAESAEPEVAAVPVAVEGGEGEAAKGPTSPWLSPGFMFYSGLGTVFLLGIPGWFWALSLKVIDATMQREDLKEDRIHADVFESVALGFRVIFWPFILMLPLLPVFAGIAWSMGGLDVVRGSAAASTGLIALLASIFAVPYLFYPQALVHMTVRHRFKAWILWDQLIAFLKNAPATFYWWVVAIAVFLPIIVLVVGVGLNAHDALEWSYAQLDALAAMIFGFIMDVNDPATRPLFFTILFSLFLPAALGVVAAPIAFLGAFPALFLMRVTGLYGFYRRETLNLVTHVATNQPAGFWVRFLCRAIDYSIVGVFWVIMFQVPNLLVAAEFPLGRYFGGGIIAAVNVGFVAIAGSKNARASMIGIGLGVLAGVTFIYGETIEFFRTVFMVLYWLVLAYNVGMYYVVNEASTSRSTIGKEAFGLIAQAVEKQKELTMNQALLRHVGRVLSDALLGLPYIMCVFTPRKQALHDTLAKAEVVFRGDTK